MAQVTTNQIVRYNGFIWESGAVIEVDAATSTALIAAGVATSSSTTDIAVPTVSDGGETTDAAVLAVIE